MIDANYIKPFVVAAKNLFETMINVPFSLGKPSLKTGSQVPPHEISSIIGLSGNVTGSVVISLSREVAFLLASALLGDEITELNEDCIDAIGEIARAHGIETLYFADQELCSILGIWTSHKVILYGR